VKMMQASKKERIKKNIKILKKNKHKMIYLCSLAINQASKKKRKVNNFFNKKIKKKQKKKANRQNNKIRKCKIFD
jgi:uncharacterized protein YacL